MGTPAEKARRERRSGNLIQRLHHSAIRTDDIEATRDFYEGILGLPLVHTMKMALDPTTGQPNPYLHCFFEMGDGAMIAFFYMPGRDQAPTVPQDAFDHHFAVKATSFDALVTIKERLDAAKVPSCGINHGFCYSLYVRDPNGVLIEIVADPENELELNEAYAERARRDLESWRRGDRTANEDERAARITYPLPTSPFEDMARVLPAERG